MASAPTTAPYPVSYLLPDLSKACIGAALDPRSISAISSSSTSSVSPNSRSSAHPANMTSSASASSSSQPYLEAYKEYNKFSSAYSKRVGTASTANNSRTALIPGRNAQTRMPSYAGASPQRTVGQMQSRVYGLTPDLRDPTSSTTNAPAVDDATHMARLLNDHKPNFSVEVFASDFDHRGYPVIAGRGATVRGVVRMPAATGCDVKMTISAHTTSGAPAATWQGIALAPFSASGEKAVFEIEDHLVANHDLARPRSTYAPKSDDTLEPAQVSDDDMVLPVPFSVQLPLGKATRFIDGEMQAVPVALPPSFEISSKHAAQERREVRLATKGKAKLPAAKELLEKGFEKVYRIGCYYQVTWTLLRPNNDRSKKSSSKSAKEPAEGDTLTLPFIFLGEPTSIPPHPPTLPSIISPDVFLDANTTLGDQWTVHRSQAKWSGSLLKAPKKTVDLELHLPNPPVLQAPSVLPVMIVLRPTDPTLLSQVRTRAPSETSTAPGSPAVGHVDDPIETLSSPNLSLVGSPMAPSSPPSKERDIDSESITTTRSIMSRFLKSSQSSGRLSGSTVRKGPSSIFSGRRPNTAPSSHGSGETSVSNAMTDRTYVAGGALPNLVSLVCLSLIQTTFSSNDNINDAPEHRRKLLSVADLEEVDVHTLLLSSDGSGSGSQAGSRPGSSRSPEQMTHINEAAAAVKAAGVRVLVGSLKVAGTTPPGFRCHGLEVKYALKVDLLPANRSGGSDGVEKAMRGLGLHNRSRNWSDGFSTTASIHTQTQFTSLSNEGLSPPPTPPNVATSMFGERGPANRAQSRSTGSRTASPLSGAGTYPNAQTVGLAISTADDSALPADQPSAAEGEVRAPVAPHPNNAASPPMPTRQLLGRTAPSVYGSAASTRSGWGSGQSVSDASNFQSSIYMSEWGRDRKTVSKINKTIGEMWLDIRVVRGYNAY